MSRLLGRAALALLLPSAAMAQTGGQGATSLSEIEVVATTPVGAGPGTDRSKLPYGTSVLTSADVARTGSPSVLRSLEESVGGVSLSNAQSNPFQPNLVYRGFEASPLGGNAQGLAVYLNGARFNQAFGDTVNWDLIPDVAVDRITVEGSNPAFGLNALGGSINVALKNGFTYQGTELQTWAGSFGRLASSFQHGEQSGNASLYVAGTALSEDGWRRHSPSRLRTYYGDIGWKGDGGELHVNYIGAHNNLTGNGTSPVELLAASPRDVFTYPDNTQNDFDRFGASANIEVDKEFSLQANAYYGRFRHRTKNGDTSEVEPCAGDATLLCSEDAGFIRDRLGRPIPNFLTNSPFLNFPVFAERFAEGGPYAQLNKTDTDTKSGGASLQGTHAGAIFGRPNRLVFGGSIDAGDTDFRASSFIGGLTLDRGFFAPAYQFSTADGAISPVSINARNAYKGLYFSDNLEVTDQLTVTLGGRYNDATITLRDKIGTELNGEHHYTRFNPAAGAAFKVTPNVTVYGGYSEANRAPTPAELSCADETSPCSLTNFFVGDPHLNQVVARTVEMGLRGTLDPAADTVVKWKAGIFRARSDDDIIFVSSSTPGRAFFRNVGTTRRQGIEAGASLTHGRFEAFVEYAFTDATFQSPLVLNSPENPAADANGEIFVRPGDRLPGIPRHMVKLGFSYGVTEEWKVGATARVTSGKYLVGDESNLNPPTAPYAVLNLNTSYQLNKHVQLFGFIENALDKRYATFGTFSPVGRVPILFLPNISVTRSLSPGMPFAAYGGMKVTF